LYTVNLYIASSDYNHARVWVHDSRAPHWNHAHRQPWVEI